MGHVSEELTKAPTVEFVGDGTGATGIILQEEKAEGVLVKHPGVSMKRFTDEQKKILEQPIPPDELDILPTGEVYASQVRYRRILNDAFGPGGWGLVPTGDFKQDGDTLCREYTLFAEGRWIASAIGEAEFKLNNPRYTKATAAESLKSNALMRCCKDLLIASECWDKRANAEWIKKFAVAVWCVGRAGDIMGKKKKLWRRRDAERFEYPWKEDGVPEPPPPPDPPDDVPARDVKADQIPPTPAPTQAEIASPGASGSEKPPARKVSPENFRFVQEMSCQKRRVGRQAYYSVLGFVGSVEHASELTDRKTQTEVYHALKSLPDEKPPEPAGPKGQEASA